MFQRTLRQTTWEMGRNIVVTSMAVPLQNLSITVKAIRLKQDSLQLSQKQKTFSEFVFAFSKSILNFKHLPKNDDPHS